jgi:hypothetical protein
MVVVGAYRGQIVPAIPLPVTFTSADAAVQVVPEQVVQSGSW